MTMLPYLKRLEQTELQKLNIFCYNIAVGRAQIILKLSDTFYFAHAELDEED